jgi:hypothetical protein
VIVNFGCGANPATGASSYINVDGSLTVLLARLPLPTAAFASRANFVRVLRANDIRYGTSRRLRFPEGTLDGFYASHVLEHLSKRECRDLMLRVQHWLKPSGVLRVVLPDLRRFAEAYVEGATDASQFVANTCLAPEGLNWWETLFGHSQHRWMYDAASFSKLLEDLGFREIKECKMNQGRLPDLSNLDITSRQMESFYIEAGK